MHLKHARLPIPPLPHRTVVLYTLISRLSTPFLKKLCGKIKSFAFVGKMGGEKREKRGGALAKKAGRRRLLG